MAITTGSITVGVFEDRAAAERAIDELRAFGFRSNQIGVVTRDAAGNTKAQPARTAKTGTNDSEEHTGEGAVAGAVAGAGIGGLVGLGVLAGVIPVIGPAIAAGTLGVILSNAAGGAAIAGLTGAMIGWGIPKEHAEYYEGELSGGRVVVTVHSDGRTDEASDILHRNGAHDYAQRPGS